MTSPGPYANANSAPSEPDPASVFGQPVSPMNRLRDSIAVQPSAGPGVFGAVKTGYRAGKQLAAEQPGWPTVRPQVGPVNAPMGYARESTVDAQGPPVDHTANNADAPASQESLDALHQKVTDLQGSVSGMSNSGAAAGSQGGQYRQSGTAKTPFLTPVSPLQQMAEKHQQALAGMLASHQNLAQSRASTAAHFAQRQQAVQGVRVAPAASAIGMSADYAQRSFYGQQGSGNGTSANTWESSRWAR